MNGGIVYDIELHKHREAAWSASTSARASKLCRFSVEKGTRILEQAGFEPSFAKPFQLPTPGSLDEIHADWRERVIAAANQLGVPFTHGVAAKLINCYLKSRFVCGGHHRHPNVRGLHPPVDAILLESLAASNVGGFSRKWRQAHRWAWSKFSSEQYQDVIDHIRKVTGRDMWKIEAHWQGFQ